MIMVLLLTYGERHDLQFVPHQFDHHAFLQRCGTTAEHRTAAPGNSQEFILQALVQGVGQGPTVNDQAQAVHHEGRRG